jgi:threonine dehydrogenase-like Zn-dependent dehydrogenase
MNIFRRAEIRDGQTVAVVGVGFLGSILIRLARRAGARVIGISRRDFARKLGTEMGAEECIPLEGRPAIVGRVSDLTSGGMCDRVIECVGAQWALDLSAELTKERGRLVIAGYHQDGPRAVNMQLWNWRGLDVVNAHERETAVYVRGMREALEVVEDETIDPDRLLTHRYRLDELADALRATEGRPDGFVKALVIP